jgi:hypothetical protein
MGVKWEKQHQNRLDDGDLKIIISAGLNSAETECQVSTFSIAKSKPDLRCLVNELQEDIYSSIQQIDVNRAVKFRWR